MYFYYTMPCAKIASRNSSNIFERFQEDYRLNRNCATETKKMAIKE